jgi:hypothetical protein
MKYDEVSKGMTWKELTYQQKELCLHDIPDTAKTSSGIPADAEMVLVFHAVNQAHIISMGLTVTPVLIDRFPALHQTNIT